ncbi:CAMK family protein kinase [Trichomonas vaginalis G3]|uniref:CAMK family protein kinase n=1 Tax=Trichomonas vaginalis (strain ATCC PRA-98 / G3) TaxID=412133 RepID=A2FA80_TRIV3|nr:protein serine/threonine kinase protein [Trichomonas vaginalis G3]EAX98216.1 CAMK family protein kinase [Trichomonas vaginalis G3]KAI5533978.1 protein serine/threonine kinase protein [Trichomonas vaginalis G3]|eukprot:XP_001311146.1 CAMK family protein kinase [Trichomonas vaginalis G3]
MFIEEDIEGYTIQIPLTFSGYRYLTTLGKGMFACVVLVENIRTNEKFACKIISREKMEKDNLIIRLEEELRILEHIKHPAIVDIYRIIYQEKLIMIIMEFCSGGEMLQKVTQGPTIRESEICRYAMQILSAINYLHQRDIMHRDIKLENIMIDQNGDAKLIDFGLSEAFGEQNLKTHCGTLLYMAPEIICQHEFDGKAVDIWAFGIVIYVMVTRCFPWKSTTDEGVIDEIIDTEIFFPNFISPVISAILHRSLAKDPSKRATAQELITLISSYSTTKGISMHGSKTHYNGELLLMAKKRRQPAKLLIKPHKSVDIPFLKVPKPIQPSFTFDQIQKF